MADKMVKRAWGDADNKTLHYIRFVEVDGEWWAVLKDICDALGLEARHVTSRIDANLLLKRTISTDDGGDAEDYAVSNGIISKPYHRTHLMTLVNELGIYQCISGSRKVEARKFNLWYPTIIRELRKGVGLKGYQAMDMMNEDVQKHITKELKKVTPDFDPYSDIYYDEDRGMLMRSVTVAGGDVEQVPYEGDGSDIPEIFKLYS